MTVLLTGASGFVGSAVARRLLAEGQSVRVLLRAGSDHRNIAELPVETINGDLLNHASLRTALSGCKSLFHVAADYRLWARDPSEIYKTNVDGTTSLMLAALEAGVERVVYTSSVATLGLNKDRSPANESTPVGLQDMIGHYKRSKYLAEQKVLEMVDQHGLPAVIVNPSTPVGPRDIKPTPTGKMIVDAASNRIPAYVDTGLNLVHVDDVAEGHWLAYRLGQVGERYILGNENLTLKQILKKVSYIAGSREPYLKIPHAIPLVAAYLAETWVGLIGKGEPAVSIDSVKMAKKYMFFSIDKARQELGFSPQPVDGALRASIEWFQQNGYCR